ncbi:uncharacterized protein PAC_05788 [Phialocephala subalpina]|uniref:Uncharacterized protein n=1 Tax=Phialocephala subalpina TaxID=576137 RepID=A0A1L7WT02_9HELO|nr:uncharacterized protein PAC_05788 [Phialocephala subalpina]
MEAKDPGKRKGLEVDRRFELNHVAFSTPISLSSPKISHNPSQSASEQVAEDIEDIVRYIPLGKWARKSRMETIAARPEIAYWKEHDRCSPAGTQFLFFNLFPPEIKVMISEELISTDELASKQGRFIEIERQFDDRDPLTYHNPPCARTTGRISASGGVTASHAPNPSHHHNRYRVSKNSRRTPDAFCNLSSISRRPQGGLCLDLPRQSRPGQRRFSTTSKTVLVILQSRDRHNPVLAQRLLHNADTVLHGYTHAPHRFSTHRSQVQPLLLPLEHTAQAIEILYGIDAAEFDDDSPASESNRTVQASEGQTIFHFPGCKGFRELMMLALSDCFRQPGGGAVDWKTFPRQYHDVLPDPYDYVAFNALKIEEERIRCRNPLSRLENTVHRWLSPSTTTALSKSSPEAGSEETLTLRSN